MDYFYCNICTKIQQSRKSFHFKDCTYQFCEACLTTRANTIRDLNLNFKTQKCLFCDAVGMFSVNVDGSNFDGILQSSQQTKTIFNVSEISTFRTPPLSPGQEKKLMDDNRKQMLQDSSIFKNEIVGDNVSFLKSIISSEKREDEILKLLKDSGTFGNITLINESLKRKADECNLNTQHLTLFSKKLKTSSPEIFSIGQKPPDEMETD